MPLPGAVPPPGQEARGPPRAARNCIQMSDPCLPVGVDSGSGAPCLACGSGSQGSHAGGHGVPAAAAARCSRVSPGLKGISFRRQGHLAPLSAPPPSAPPLPPLRSKAAVPGLCQHSARLHCAGPWLCGRGRPSALPPPPRPAGLQPLQRRGRRAGTRERPRFAVCPAKWQGIPGRPAWHCLATEAP